jgi:hypothetical protein
MPKTQKTETKRWGNIMQEKTNTNVNRKLLGRTKVKQFNTVKTTNFDTQKMSATGTMSKTVTNRKGQVIKSNTKALSPRKIINRGY